MKFFSAIPSWILNKYLIATAVFMVWLLFFDRNDMLTQMDRRRELRNLQNSKAYYTQEIANEKKSLEDLKSNPAAIEKFAREKYLMKRDDEDIFLIQSPENK